MSYIMRTMCEVSIVVCLTLQSPSNAESLFTKEAITNATVHISPVEQPQDREKSVTSVTWENDDWNIVEPSSLNLGAVSDERWQDIPEILSNVKSFKLTNSLSFSVWNADMLNFHISGEESANQISIDRIGLEPSWNNYTAFIWKRIFYVFENNNLINIERINDRTPEKLVVKTVNYTHWKTYNNSVRVAYNISQRASVLTIPPTGRRYIFLYTAQCANCTLNVSVTRDENNMTNYEIKPTHNRTKIEEMNLISWEKIKIDIDPNQEVKMDFTRNVQYGDKRQLISAIDYKFGPYSEKEKEYTQPTIFPEVMIIGPILLCLIIIAIIYVTFTRVRKRICKKKPDEENMEANELLTT